MSWKHRYRKRNIGSRAEILRQTTDLFVAGSGYFDNEQMALFDDVMNRLVNEIDHSARVTFGETLAATDKSPPKVTRTLALDDSIDVAGPVLRRSESLDDETLIVRAKTKGQDHLLAIARVSVRRSPTFSWSAGTRKWSSARLRTPVPAFPTSVVPHWSRDRRVIASLRYWCGHDRRSRVNTS